MSDVVGYERGRPGEDPPYLDPNYGSTVKRAPLKPLVRLEHTQRLPQQQSATWIERQMSKVHAALRSASTALGERPWCNGQSYTLADISLGCALGWLDFGFPSIDWRTSHPNLARHCDKLSVRSSFVETAPPKT